MARTVPTPTIVGKLENELRETLKRYEIIFRATHDVLYDLNLITTKVVWNEALYTQFGYDENESAEQMEWWTKRVHPDDAMRVERAFGELVESGGSNWDIEFRFLRANGTYAYVHDRGYILRGADGAPLRLLGSYQDISKQKELERAKDEFSSLISHQLRTPLTVIQIYSDLLADGTFGKMTTSQQHEVRKIHDSSVKLIELVNDILAISSIELQQVQVNLELADLNEIVSQSVLAVTPLAEKKHVGLLFHRRGGLNQFRIDSRLLEQVLHNLLTNAIRYSPADRGIINVRISAESESCVVSVKDNGIGIPLDARPHVFERFYRAQNAINAEQHGTGLGLYYVQLVTQLFGGQVWFKTSRGKGTTFFVRVPKFL